MSHTPASMESKTLSGDTEEREVQERETPYEHLAIHDVSSVHEDVDPRLSLSSRPSATELDESFPQHLQHTLSGEHSHHHHHRHDSHQRETKDVTAPDSKERAQIHADVDLEKAATGADSKRSQTPGSSRESEEIIYVDWEPNDPRNPENFSRTRKWIITLSACIFTGLSAAAAASYAMGFPSMMRDLNCTQFQATIGLSTYPLGFGVTPLLTAPLSEEFGRNPLYFGSAILFLLMHVAVALSKNIQSVLIFRFIAGVVGSTGSTMVGGTVADIWAPHERGLPMAAFAVSAIGGTGLGPIAAGWTEQNSRFEWRWIQWFHVIVTGVYTLSLFVTMKETRSGVLLTRLARKLRKETGDKRYRARIEDERGSMKSLIMISCTRPIYLLLTEPVVASFSLWIGFAWGILYSLIESISPAFKTLHHFSQGAVGTVFITTLIGSILGFISHFLYQEKVYDKNFKKRGPEARLYSACVAGVLFPAAMFLYAWTSLEKVNWIGMAIGITLFIWAVFVMYLAVFTYLADCYGTFASSALAGQSLCRNLMGTAFPLFSQQMYDNLTFKWASTLFGFIAAVMMPIPFILFFWGPQIRARSKFASRMMKFE